MFLQTAQHKPRRSRSQTPPRRQRLFWLSAWKAAETKVKTSGRMATARCGSAQLGAAPPALSPPPFSTGSSGQGALPHVPPAGHHLRRALRGALPGHFPSSHNPPPSKPPSVLPNLLRTTKKNPPFTPKKSHFPISPRCTQLPIPAPLPAAGRTWPGIFWRRPRLCFEHRATHAEQPLGAKPP